MLAAFFIVTDPVTGCMSPRGRLFFGLGAGLLTVWLTRVAGMPDGLPFAVLSMNFAAPWLDRHTRPVRQRQGAQP
jgi:electron transport complex protein RnfD